MVWSAPVRAIATALRPDGRTPNHALAGPGITFPDSLPIPSPEMHEREAILNLWRDCAQAALATVVEVKGSAYRRAGARMILSADGRSAGVLNGGCLDADLWARARMAMENGRAQLAVYDTQSSQDIVFGLGLGCRGVVKILIEPIHNLDWLRDEMVVTVGFEGTLGTRLFDGDFEGRPRVIETASGRAYVERLEVPQSLLIFGAGADAVPLARMGELLGWNVRVLDPRAPHAARPVHLESEWVAPEKLGELEIARGAACVLMTHNFLHDLEILKRVLPSEARYVGVLGPHRRTRELLEQLGGETLAPALAPTPAQLAKLHAPIGLDLGSEAPAEIALAIVAEIQKTARQKSGLSLRELDAIH